ncbi:MAG: DUF3343 domain-containing protein [Bacillota bacterium]
MMTLYTFVSVHHMMRAEKSLKEKAINCDVIPTPRAISTSCGLSIVLSAKDAAWAAEIFQQKDILLDGVYPDAEKYGYYKAEGKKA